MIDSEDLLLDWSPEDVAETSSGAAPADIYGKLFYFLRTTLSSSLGRMSTMKLSFKLLQVDVNKLLPHIQNKRFDRIEASRPPIVLNTTADRPKRRYQTYRTPGTSESTPRWHSRCPASSPSRRTHTRRSSRSS